MPAFLSRWNTLKTGLDADIQAADVTDAELKTILSALQKTTGFTPALKDADAALKARHRKPAVQALLRFYELREPYVRVLGKAMAHASIDDALQMSLNQLSHALKKLEVDIQAEVKSLQEEKGGDDAAPSLLLLFEADLKQNIETAKKDLKPLAAIDKNHDVLTLVEPAVKLMKAYSDAAARTKNKEALDALKKFVESAGKVTVECKKILAKEKNAAYTKAVTRFYKDLDTMCSQRVNVQVRALEKHLAG